MQVVQRRVALAVQAVDPHAPGAIVTEAPAQVDAAAELRRPRVIGRHPRQVLRQRALGHHVDDAAHPAVGRHAVQQRGRPLQHLDPLDVVGEHVVIRRHAIDAVEGDLAQVAFAYRKAADVERVRHAADLAGEAHRGIDVQRVGQRHRLAVGQQVRGVVGDAERRIHHIAVAQQAQAAATRHLAARVAGRQRRGMRVRARHHDVRQQRGLALRRQLAQRIGAAALLRQRVAGARQQPREALAHRVDAVQAVTMLTRQQGRIEGQRHAGGGGEAGQRVAQRAGGNRIGLAARRADGIGGARRLRGRRRQRQRHAQAKGAHRGPRGRR